MNTENILKEKVAILDKLPGSFSVTCTLALHLLLGCLALLEKQTRLLHSVPENPDKNSLWISTLFYLQNLDTTELVIFY